ncbi:MAG: relaxase/mobilization nuclease domain-containing protein [Clostridia bacterium]|nr:relaxase/mobilization nuclease domain-containing protein [Clostridia bacterium]
MATTKIWKFKSKLNRLINYVSDPAKTNDKEFVTGINCYAPLAYKEMLYAKKQYFKEGGIECFHGYQSFVEGEVSPEEAHAIGLQLAQKLWGDRFQVIVATHSNTDNIHNHFVINSVSFVDGKRFNNTKSDYGKMRIESDNLCKEYGLNVLPHQPKYEKYVASELYKTLMKDSIDYAIENSNNYDEFINMLKELDYDVNDDGNFISLKKAPYKRNLRIENQFGEDYSKDNIYKRILETQNDSFYSKYTYLKYIDKFQGYYIRKEKYSLLELILRVFLYKNSNLYVYTNNTVQMPKLTPELIKDLKQLDEYSIQAEVITKYKLKVEDDIKRIENELNNKLAPLQSERDNLWKKIKRPKNSENKSTIEEQIKEISKKINPILLDIKTLKNIKERLEEYKEIELHRQLEEQQKEPEISKKKDRIR